MKPLFEWFARDGKPGLAAIEHKPGSDAMGFLTVQPDGSVWVNVDDDYYDGTISRDDAVQLALAILDACGLPRPVVVPRE